MLRPTRRALIGSAGGALALASMPAFLAACARKLEVAAAPAVASPEDAVLAWFGVDRELIRRVLGTLGARGAHYGELYFQHARGTSVALEDGIVGRASVDIDQGVGLRAVVGDQVGYAFTQDLTEEALHEAARTAAAIAAGGDPKVPPVALRASPPGDRYVIGVPWGKVGVEQRLELVRSAEAQTREAANGREATLQKVSVSFADTDEKVLIADLAGNVIVDDRPMSRLWVSVTAKKGDEVQSNRSNLAGRHGLDWYGPERLRQVATEAVDRTYVLFDAVRPKAGEMPVVLAAGASGILLHEAIGHGMEADFNRKDISIYASMIGRKVAPDYVTIVDDGTQPGERGALNYDDEGTPAERTVLVRDGVLESYLHDRISAAHYGRAGSTGSGRRESYRHPPLPRMRSTYMESGPHGPDEILAGIEYGILAETFTNGQVQIGAGDFTFFVKNGRLIENGKLTAPIKDVNIIGNGPAALERVTRVGADSKLDTGGWTCGKDGQSVPVSQGMPTVLVSSLTVGGTDV